MSSKNKPNQALLANIPSMTVLLKQDKVIDLMKDNSESFVQECLGKVIDEIRSSIVSGQLTELEKLPEIESIINRTSEMIDSFYQNKLLRVINGAGVILHTGLGRAALSSSALDALKEASSRYCLLATDRKTGKRGDRNRHNEELLCQITGTEAALVVNNNSAAVMLVLNTFAEGKESIVSRGELVEIGGAFRIPDVMERSNTIMVEVGTTNKTHLKDYQNAITGETAILLKVHTSNYRIVGFHKEVPEKELAELAHDKGLIVVMDLGSGALIDLELWGLPHEPTVQQAVSDGVDIITFSGDKMIGGPQCGIILGNRELINRLSHNPLMRAFRCGKLTHSALNGTLRLFLNPEKLIDTHPVYSMIATPMDIIKRRAQRIARWIRKTVDLSGSSIEVQQGITQMGSGSLPGEGIPTFVVSFRSTKFTIERFAFALREATPPLFTRIADERILIDARTIADEEVRQIADCIAQAITICEKGKDLLTGYNVSEGIQIG